MQADYSIVNKRLVRNKWLAWTWPMLVIVGVSFLVYYRLWIWNPLPRDEEMIEHFQAHRADFEEAVRRYREYPHLPDKDTSLWFKEGDTLEVYKRAGIDSITYLIPMWLPNPYSVETAIFVDKIVDQPGRAPFEKYSSLGITPATTPRIDHPDIMDDSGFRKFSLKFGIVWKSYYYTPEEPRVVHGKMLWPLTTVGKGFPGSTYHELERVSVRQSESQVLSTLDVFPDNWGIMGCVYRQIEPQWFLQMCTSNKFYD